MITLLDSGHRYHERYVWVWRNGKMRELSQSGYDGDWTPVLSKYWE